jgi:glycosyltransferase involved in cell wall biosynthesis
MILGDIMSGTETKECRVSIITVCYNAASTIERTIKSVIDQTYKNIEYIIIDGGSSDGTTDIIRKYNKHINYWVSEPDRGIYDAMNKGISIASGDVIGIINADDYYRETSVEAAVDGFSSPNSPDIVYGDIILLHDSAKKMRRLKPSPRLGGLLNMSVFHPAVFAKKHCYDRFGVFDCNYRLSSDHELMLRFFCNNALFYYNPNVIVFFSNNGASFKNAVTGIKETRDIAIKYGCNKACAYLWCYYTIAKYKLKTSLNYH